MEYRGFPQGLVDGCCGMEMYICTRTKKVVKHRLDSKVLANWDKLVDCSEAEEGSLYLQLICLLLCIALLRFIVPVILGGVLKSKHLPNCLWVSTLASITITVFQYSLNPLG